VRLVTALSTECAPETVYVILETGLGTDISDDAVARASRGIVSPVEISRGLSDARRTKYYVPVAVGWQIRDEIRAMASFKKLNLTSDFSGLGRFDVVFCPNVAICFTERDKISLFSRIERVLEPDGLPGDRRHGIAEWNLPAV
jgi:chemotaxis protein methyltransferase CheR